MLRKGLLVRLAFVIGCIIPTAFIRIHILKIYVDKKMGMVWNGKRWREI